MKLEAPQVDTHFHVYTRDLPLAGDAWHAPTEDAPIDQLIRTLDENGVPFGVVAAASMYGDYNDYTALALKQHKRLRGTAIINPGTAISVLRRMRDQGFVGIRFQWRYLKTLPDLHSLEYRLLLRQVNDLGWHVHLHDNSPRLGPIVQALEESGVRLVIDHFGRPDPALGVNCPGFKAVLRSVEKGNTWVKVSAGYRFEPPALAKDYAAALLKVAGGERLMWGSDWPHPGFEGSVTYRDTIAAFADWFPDEHLRRQIGGATPLKFYFT